MDSAEEIIRDIAAVENPGDTNPEDWGCGYCGATVYDRDWNGPRGGYDGYTNDPKNHPESCVWRRSKQLILNSNAQIGNEA